VFLVPDVNQIAVRVTICIPFAKILIILNNNHFFLLFSKLKLKLKSKLKLKLNLWLHFQAIDFQTAPVELNDLELESYSETN